MNEELVGEMEKILTILDELDVIEILRRHVPEPRRYLVDRLEWSLRAVGRIDGEIDSLYALLDDEPI
jgi:hypothetical protein